MLKVLLCVGVLVLCVLLAYVLARKYRQRRDFYYALSQFNERLYNEVSYSRASLPAFAAKYAFGGDFKKLLEERLAVGFRSAPIALSYLSVDERQFVSDYFGMIGKSDAASQQSYLAARRKEVEELRQESEKAYKKHFSLYLKLGVLAGLVLVILIV